MHSQFGAVQLWRAAAHAAGLADKLKAPIIVAVVRFEPQPALCSLGAGKALGVWLSGH